MTKPTWIFVAGIYRSASTTQYQIVRDIVESTNSGIGIGYHREDKLREFDVDSANRYIVCKVFEFLPDNFRGGVSRGKLIHRENRLKATVTIRDPRDIITSMMERHRRHLEDPKHQSKPFDFVHRATVDFPIWLGHLQSWIDLGDSVTLVSRYEVFTKDLSTEVSRIANHIDISLSDDEVKTIATRYTKDAMQSRKKQLRKEKKREDPWLPGVPAVLFGYSGSHKDRIGDKDLELLESHNESFMKKWGYL